MGSDRPPWAAGEYSIIMVYILYKKKIYTSLKAKYSKANRTRGNPRIPIEVGLDANVYFLLEETVLVNTDITSKHYPVEWLRHRSFYINGRPLILIDINDH